MADPRSSKPLVFDRFPVEVKSRIDEQSWSAARLGTTHLFVEFRGQVTAEAGRESAIWTKENAGDGHFSLVFDARTVTGYASGARKAWEEVLIPDRKRIDGLVLLANSTLVVMGATMFGLAMGFPVKRVSSIEELGAVIAQAQQE